jgi:hypothetical protein
MAAGFWAGFGKQVSTDYAKRQDTLDTLIKENLDNARLAKRDYAKRTGLADQILKSTQAIQSTYGLKDEQAIALAEAYGTDLPGLQMKLAETNDQLMSTSGVGLGAEQVMSYVNMTNELAPLEDMTKLQAIQKLMGLNVAELAKEANPKAEGSQTRSFIRAALAFDPQLQAAEQMESIKGPNGISYAELLEMQEAGFAPQDVYGGVTRGSGLAYDYTVNTAKQTANDYTKALSVGLYDIEIDDTVSWNNLSTQDKTLDKKQARANIQGAGQALARLERSIVLENIGKDLSLSAFRRGVLDSIYDRIDNPEELVTLKESVANGTALKIVQATGGKLTDDDIDAIIAGTTTEEQKVEPTITAAASSADVTAASSADSTATKTNVIRPVTKVDEPIQSSVERMLAEQGIEAEPLGLSDEEKRLRSKNTEEPTSDSDAAIIAEALARSDAIDDKLEAQRSAEEATLKRIQDNDRQFTADENNFPQPLGTITTPSEPEEAPLIDTKLVNTGDDLRAAIEARTGVMPTDYIAEAVPAVKRMNKALKEFEKSVNVNVDKAIETVTPSNIGEAIHNLIVRMFDTVVGDETLEERIMKNEGQQNRAAAFAKLQEQLGELTLFPKRVSVDMKDIDPYPTMDQMASERLHSLQDDINDSILSTTKKFLSSIGIGSKKEEDSSKPASLMAKPKKAKKPKEMTSSDKARLKRAKKARELGKDTGLLEMLVEKYGIAIVQKEMGL